jgi:hypothetical protein
MMSLEVPLFRVRNGLTVTFADGQEPAYPAKANAPASARSLALGYRLQRALDRGEVGSHRELATRMGVSHTRVSMLISLTFLVPAIQQILLAGGPEAQREGFHPLLRISRLASWAEQRQAWAEIHGDPVTGAGGCRDQSGRQ